MRFTFAILAGLAALVAVPAVQSAAVADDSDDLATKVKELAGTFKIFMQNGQPDLAVPVMDPGVVSEIAVSAAVWPIHGKFVADNIKVTGASNFELTNVAQISGTNKVSIQFTIPTITVANNYDFDGIVKVGFIKFDVKEQGLIEATIEGLKVSAVADLAIDSDKQLSLHSLRVESWTHDNIQINFNELATKGFIKRNFNKLLNKLSVSLLVTPHYEDLSLWASQNGERVFSRFLDIIAGRTIVPNLDNRASDLLNQLKVALKQGSTTLPVLDPATIESVTLPVQDTLVDGSIVGKDITINGTSSYTITKLTRKEGTNQLSLELAVDDIVANGKFDASGNIVLWVVKKPFKDSGSLQVTIKGLKVVATANMGEDINSFLYLKNLEIDSWTYDEIKTEFGNLQNYKIGKILNDVVNKMLPLLIKVRKAALTSWAEETSRTVVEEFLQGVAQESVKRINVQLTSISKESQDIISDLVHLAYRAGLAEAA